MKERITYLDYVRSLACLLVLLVHSQIPSEADSDPWAAIYTLISIPCIGLFFMTSGALIFPVKEQVNIFLKKKANRIIIPFIFWTIFYLITNIILGITSLNEVPVTLIKLLYSPAVCGVLWFIYALIGLYLFAPIISKWLEGASKKDLQYFLGLWAITLLFPYFNIDSLLLTNFSGYLGYMVLGFYLRKYPLKMGYVKMGILTILLSIIIPMIIKFKFFSFTADKEVLIKYLTIHAAWLSIVYFTLLQRFNFRPHKAVTKFASLSFGIYLIHIFIENNFVKEWIIAIGPIPTVIYMPLVATITLIITYTIVWLISLTKVSKYIIG